MSAHPLLILLTAALLSACAEPDSPDATRQPQKTASAPAAVKPAKPLPPPAPAPKKLTSAGVHANQVKQYDGNGDGKVSTREALVQPFQRLMAFDSDGNRVLTAAEFHKALGDLTGKDETMAALFKQLDADKNGGLDEKEIVAYMWPGIVAADRNSDNQVDTRDLQPSNPKKSQTP